MSSLRALAIETSGQNGSVALVENSAVIAEASFPHGLKHAAGLLPLIDSLMRQRQWNPSDLQHLYVSQGPGSFTGLRIGVTLAKTLAFATGARIVPVPSLHVIAMNAPIEAEHVIVVLDAKRDQIFSARYERQGDRWIALQPTRLTSLSQMLAESPRPVHLIGEGIPYHEKFLPDDRAGIIVAPPALWRARAAVVADLGIQLGRAEKFAEPDQFVPLYVRIPEAEEKYESLHRSAKPA